MVTSAAVERPAIEYERNIDNFFIPKASSTDVRESGHHMFMRPYVADTERESTQAISSPVEKEFGQKLLYLLKEEPVEDGYSHPAELVLDETLRANRNGALWIQTIFIENHNNPTLATGILKCIGRLRRDLIEPWGRIMAKIGLSEPSLEIREAAVTALELWGDKRSLEMLKNHTESAPWLARYIKQVIKDLSY
jgi:hypothetical protein